MSRPSGSVARQAFVDARAVVAAAAPAWRDDRPAVDVVDVPGYGPSGAGTAGDSPRPGHGPLHDALAAQAAGATSARALVEAALAAIEDREPALGAVVERCPDALEVADELDRARAAGRALRPLHGVPVTVKDIIDVAGVPTRAGSEAYLATPARDASSVAALRAAGAVVLAKVATHEFALGVTAPLTSNPHDLDRLAGGSSGGSAAGLAAGIGLASLGTDTRASIRVPAALSGVVGLKPTYGVVPTDGVVSLSWTMDHVAPMAVTVDDAALVLDVLAPQLGVPGHRRSAGVPAGLRIGVPAATFDGAEDDVVDAVEGALALLEKQGATLVPVDRPSAADLDLAGAAGLLVSRCEAAAYHGGLDLDRSRYWQEVAEQLEEAAQVAAVEYLEAQRARGALRRDLLGVFAEVDVLAMPTAPVVAPRRDDFARHLVTLARNAIPFSFVGFPAISVPCGPTGALPVGLQVVAPPFADALVVDVGRAVERLASG